MIMKHFFTLVLLFLLSLQQAMAGKIQSAAGGLWSNTTTWVGNIVPGTNDTVVIKNGHVVTVPATQDARAVLVETGGELYIIGGRLTVQDTILNNGALRIESAGNLFVNGLPGKGITSNGFMRVGYFCGCQVGNGATNNCTFISNDSLLVNPGAVLYVYGSFASNGALTQDGGDISVNGTHTTAAGSVPDTRSIIYINGTRTQCTVGSITIASPHHSSMFPFVNTVEIGGNNLNAFSGIHTINIGDGVSTNAGPNNRGITLGNGTAGGGKVPIQNMFVQSGSNAANRAFRTSIVAGTGTYIKGDVTVQSGSEFMHIWTHNPECAIGGNISVNANAYFTVYRGFTLGGIGYTVNNQQIIGGAGTFREDNFNPQYTFGSLTINNARPDTAIIFNIPLLKVRDSLCMLSGNILFQNGLELGGTSYPAPKFRYVSGYLYSPVDGYFRKYLTTAAGTISLNDENAIHPWGYAGKSRMVRIGGTVTADGFMTSILHEDKFVSAIPVPYQAMDNGIFLNTQTKLHWDIGYGAGFTATNMSIQFTGGNQLIDDATPSNLRLYRYNFLPTATTIASGTLAAPALTRTGIPAETTIWGNWAIAGNDQQLITQIPTRQSGLFNDTATWKFNYIPDGNFGGRILSGHTVTTDPNSTDQPLTMQVDNGGTLNLVAKAASRYFVSQNKTRVKGTLNVSGIGNFCGANSGDTTMIVAAGGALNINSGQLDVFYNLANTVRKAFVQVDGQLNIRNGNLNIMGSLKLAGNSGFDMTGGNLNLNPNYQADGSRSATNTVLDFQTEGPVSFTGGIITFENPPANPGVKTMSIQRSSTANIELTRGTFYIGAQTSVYGIYQGLPGTGFMVDTKAGAVNIPIGRVVLYNATAIGNRFLRNGPGGLFIRGDFAIDQTKQVRLYNDGSDNIIDGDLYMYTSGYLYAMGKLTLGGTTEFPSDRKINIQYLDGIVNDTLSPTANFSRLHINTRNGLVRLMNHCSVSQELGLTSGTLYTDSTLTLGTSPANPGILIPGNGGIATAIPYSNLTPNCAFRRWFSTTPLSFSDQGGLFPFRDIHGNDLSFTLAGTPASGGYVQCNFVRPYTDITMGAGFTDAGVTVTRAMYGLYVTKVGGGFTGSGLSIQLKGAGLNIADPTHARIVGAFPTYGLAPGIHLGASGSAANGSVTVSRTGLTQNDLSAKSFLIAFPLVEMYTRAVSVKHGNWNDPTTWDCNCIPNIYSQVQYHHNITVTTLPADRKSVLSISHFGSSTNTDKLSIQGDTLTTASYFSGNTMDTLEVAGGMLHMGADMFGNAVDFTPNNVVQVKSGQLTIGADRSNNYKTLRNFFFSPGNLIQSGGRIYINGGYYAGANQYARITSGSVLINPSSESATAYNFPGVALNIVAGGTAYPKDLNGANFYIINPVKNIYDYSVVLNDSFVPAAASGIAMATSNLYLGYDTSIADVKTSTRGFYITGNYSGYSLPFGNIIAQGNANYLNRRQTTIFSGSVETIQGSLVVKPNAVLHCVSGTVAVKGDVVNDGSLVFSNTSELQLTGSQPQNITGSGRFTYDPVPSNTYAFEPYLPILRLVNTHPGGVTVGINGRNLSIASLLMASGDLHITDTVTIGTSTGNTGFLTQSGTGAITGKLRRYIGTTATSYVFPVGLTGTERQATVTYTTPPSTGGILMAEHLSGFPGNNGLPLTEGSMVLDHTGSNGYWRFTASNGLTDGGYNIRLRALNYNGINDYTKLVLLKRPDAGMPWTLQGTHVAPTGSNAVPLLGRNGLSGFSEFAIGSNAANPLPLHQLSFTGRYNKGVIDLQWEVTQEQHIAHYAVERSADAVQFQSIARVAGKGNGNHTYAFTDRLPLHGINYYRLALTDANGSVSYSATITVHNDQEAGLTIYPNPAHDVLQLQGINGIVRLIDLNGKTCMSVPVDGQEALDVHALPRGTYLLRYPGQEGWRTQEIVLR